PSPERGAARGRRYAELAGRCLWRRDPDHAGRSRALEGPEDAVAPVAAAVFVGVGGAGCVALGVVDLLVAEVVATEAGATGLDPGVEHLAVVGAEPTILDREATANR